MSSKMHRDENMVDTALRASRDPFRDMTTVRFATLKELMESELDAVRELLAERELRYQGQFKAQDEKTMLALANSKEAVGKAEAATEKRFDSVNEFRDTLRDQASHLMPRSETVTMLKSNEEKAEVGRANLEKQIDETRAQIAALQLAGSEAGGKEKQGIFHHENAQFNMTTVIAVAALLIGLGEVAVLALKH